MARDCKSAGPPFHVQSMRKRVSAFGRTGSCSFAVRQLRLRVDEQRTGAARMLDG